MLSAIGLIVENRPGYTLSSVLNDIDFDLLSEIMEATSKEQPSQAQTTADGVSVTPGMQGVNPGNQPVLSLFDLAK